MKSWKPKNTPATTNRRVNGETPPRHAWFYRIPPGIVLHAASVSLGLKRNGGTVCFFLVRLGLDRRQDPWDPIFFGGSKVDANVLGKTWGIFPPFLCMKFGLVSYFMTTRWRSLALIFGGWPWKLARLRFTKHDGFWKRNFLLNSGHFLKYLSPKRDASGK